MLQPTLSLLQLEVAFEKKTRNWYPSLFCGLAEYPSLLDATIDELAEGLASKTFNSVDLVKAYIARVAEVNGNFQAVAELNPDALTIAAELDRERSMGFVRGPLHGIPMLIKDNIATNDQMNTTAGSYALIGAKVPRDATIVRKLRTAGVVLLGKTNLSQWMSSRSFNASSGWSALGGQVYGPYFPDQDPSGSSSGSGVAAALGLALGCLGTETDGSITLPSSYNNIAGIKPTVGLTSRYLVILASEHQDTIGPMARTVKDAAHILQAIVGKDSLDNYTSAIPNGVMPDYVAACNLSALSQTRIGIPRNVISLISDNTTGPILEAFEEALEVLLAAGATIVEDTNFTAAAEYLSTNPHIEQTWNNTDARFWPAYQRYLFYGEEGGLLGAIERYALDAVLLPANFASHWAAPVGSPIVTVPLGVYPPGTPVVNSRGSWGLVKAAPNIPFGIGFLGTRFSEAKLIGMAYAFEQRTQARLKAQPYLLPTTELVDVVGK
ncbi:amidase [Hyphodiscus hymeniophilus]|uniref:Amidase n=1 Tax=Hyphodiscus hymeniophilus TaxID=353542 RepID=A0A9P7AW45_9HELO|nr:amidase [Hyphodiscus hymeniophilus]